MESPKLTDTPKVGDTFWAWSRKYQKPLPWKITKAIGQGCFDCTREWEGTTIYLRFWSENMFSTALDAARAELAFEILEHNSRMEGIKRYLSETL